MAPRNLPNVPKQLAMLLTLASAGSAAEAGGAGNSPLGPTAEATIAISVSLAPKLEVHGLAARDRLAGSPGHGDPAFCVSGSRGMGSYSIRSLDVSDAAAGAEVSAVRPFPYRVEWARAAGSTGRGAALPLMPGAFLAGLVPASPAGCAVPGRLVIRHAALAGGPPDARALLLIIAPE